MAAQRGQSGPDASEGPIGEDDEDMGKLATVAPETPKQARTSAAAAQGITADLLRQLLQDQQAPIGATITKAVSELEARQGERFQGLRSFKVKQHLSRSSQIVWKQRAANDKHRRKRWMTC